MISGQAVRIALRGVSVVHRRGPESIRAVDDVTCELAGASMVGVVGPSGSGKTTLMNVIAGVQPPGAGEVDRHPDSTAWASVALVPQQLGLLDELSLRENVALPLRFRAGADPEPLMQRLGIDGLARRFPNEVSLGEQQRAAVCRALVSDSGVVVADEPTSHQDARRVELVADALRAQADTGALVVVSTHDRRMVERCDRVFTMTDGRLVS